jgi:hypothetical protein
VLESSCIGTDRPRDEEEAIHLEYRKGYTYSHLTHVTASRLETRMLTLVNRGKENIIKKTTRKKKMTQRQRKSDTKAGEMNEGTETTKLRR